MRRIRHLACAICLISCALLATADSTVEQVADYLGRLEKLGFSGAVLIARGGEVLLHEGYGQADRERDIAWSAQTISTIGSITKQFTGAAILRLQERGKLQVQDPITRYFEDVPTEKQAITLHQLLSHSSGIVDPPGIGDFDPIGREEYVQRVLQQPLDYEPGKGYAYSNANFSLLGAIVEQLSGKSYEVFLREEFFEPLGMSDTGYILPRFDPARLAQGYRGQEQWGTVLERPMAADGPYWALRANGGIHSTLLDMRTWCDALMNGDVLSDSALQQFWAPHVDEGGGESHYAYGWVIRDFGGQRIVTHNGGNGIHFADVAVAPEQALFIGMQCNVIADFRAANRLLEQIGPFLLAGQALPRVPDLVVAEPAKLEALAGTYRFELGGQLQVRSDAGQLLVAALDREGFTQLFSQRPADRERAERFCARIEKILGAYLKGDIEPIFAAYGGRVSREILRQRTEEQLAAWKEEYGPLQRVEVLGTAFAEERDETLARIEFERGSVLRTYVWDPQAEEQLLGVSVRGALDELRVWPDKSGDFMSFDTASGSARPLRFETDESGSVRLTFGDSNLSARRSG